MTRDAYLATWQPAFTNPLGRDRDFRACSLRSPAGICNRGREGYAVGFGIARRVIVQNKANFRPVGMPLTSPCSRRYSGEGTFGTPVEQSQFPFHGPDGSLPLRMAGGSLQFVEKRSATWLAPAGLGGKELSNG